MWVDHCEFSGGDHPDETQPTYFGRYFQWHGGALDITSASDLIAVSWNHFRRHDKTMLIGGSDSTTTDAGKLRVTFHHNWFDTAVQRTPRVRYGQVHVYNNYYLLDAANYGYSWGVGVESRIYAQCNFFETGDKKVAPSKFISAVGGANICVEGTQVNSTSSLIDTVAAYIAVHNPPLVGFVSWTPLLFLELQPPEVAGELVKQCSGVFVCSAAPGTELSGQPEGLPGF